MWHASARAAVSCFLHSAFGQKKISDRRILGLRIFGVMLFSVFLLVLRAKGRSGDADEVAVTSKPFANTKLVTAKTFPKRFKSFDVFS